MLQPARSSSDFAVPCRKQHRYVRTRQRGIAKLTIDARYRTYIATPCRRSLELARSILYKCARTSPVSLLCG